MIEQDTIKLLRECDAGIKMGVSAIEESLDYVKSDKLKKYLEDSYKENDEVKHELQKLLDIIMMTVKNQMQWPKECHGSKQMLSFRLMNLITLLQTL